ncbi:MAG: DUF3152 domain-containing protein [Acidimicrobiia bacterium]|nr:DUF3152 domain-containing protein [Acidimicrobiia bacterium]
MSTSPIGLRVAGRRRFRLRNVFRIGLAIASLLVVAAFTSGLNDLDAAESDTRTEPVGIRPVTTDPPATPTSPPDQQTATSPRADGPLVPPPADLCDALPPNECAAPPDELLQAALSPDTVPSCTIEAEHDPQGSTSVVAASGLPAGVDGSLRFLVEVEDGLAIDGGCFAEAVAAILNDSRGWGGDGEFMFGLVDDGEFDFRVVLASPDTTNRLCYPMRTAGKYSCRNGNRVVLNVMRWETGTEEYANDLGIYRQYLVNHEVGHFLGHGHRSCPGPGEVAPVMMQQTKGLRECLLNGWPTVDER